MKNLYRPLSQGDAVALVAPASQVTPSGLRYAIRLLERWGLDARPGNSVGVGNGLLAGPDVARLSDFQSAWADPAIRAIFCLRGGYGSQRIVDEINWGSESKTVVGFSDITALHLALWGERKIPSLHGPCIGESPTGFSAEAELSLWRALTAPESLTFTLRETEPTGVLSDGNGQATGTLIGGNLSVLATSVGTKGFPQLDGQLLLLEDIDEQPPQIDRMLTYLGRLGVFAKVRAVILGQFTRCDGTDGGISALDVLYERLDYYSVDFIGGLAAGHEPHAETIPLGWQARLDFDNRTLVMCQ